MKKVFFDYQGKRIGIMDNSQPVIKQKNNRELGYEIKRITAIYHNCVIFRSTNNSTIELQLFQRKHIGDLSS